jgi:predicted O-linked N-acetylglucosamine transferase (SPINDLY family)
VEAHLGAFAEALGVARQRLFFAPIASREIQLARYRLADVFLDSISYNGHASTTDALAMGLPVVTITGNSVVTRVSEAMLKSCGLSALVASGEDDFIATAVRLAQDAAWRCWVHTTLAQTKMHALFDIETRVREIEQAYEMMWSRHCAGLPPTDFDVTPMAG